MASIGTGASAIQYVPKIAPDVEQLHVFQRTPPWVMPHSARPVKPIERRALPRASRPRSARSAAAIYAARELMVLGFVKQPRGDEAAREGRRAGTASARCATPS